MLGEKVAASTVDALKSQPLALALIVINVLFLGAAVWLFHEVVEHTRADRDQRNQMTNMLVTSCGEKIIDRIDQIYDYLRDQRTGAKP